MKSELHTRAIFAFFLLFAGVIAWKLGYLQIKQGSYYKALAIGQQISFEENNGERGNIFFSDKTLLAQTQQKQVARIFSTKIATEKIVDVSEKLASIFNEPNDVILQKISNGTYKEDVTDEQIEKIKKENWDFITISEIPSRVYPNKNIASHILGFVNEDGEGQYGIEAYYNDILQGKADVTEQTKSPFGYLVFLSQKDDTLDLKGADLILTLDFQIQSFAEKTLKTAMEKWQADTGQVLILEPSTGKIITACFLPDFNPNQYQDYSHENQISVFLNSSIQKIFEPGSVMKPITMAAGLEENLVTPTTTYEDTGSANLGGPLIYNFGKKKYGEQTMTGVLEKSLNTGAVFVEQKLGGKKLLQYFEKFGFFEKTGIDLSGEVFSNNETLKNGYPRDFASASFGQGIELTSLQFIRAFGALANQGKLMKPYIVEKIVEKDGVQKITQPETQRQVISPETASKITSMLVSVVENGGGRHTKQKGYYIAGKTGTAQISEKGAGYSETKTFQSFIGYFPAYNPKYLIFVGLNNPKDVTTAEISSALIFNDIAKYIIDTKQIPPDYSATP